MFRLEEAGFVSGHVRCDGLHKGLYDLGWVCVGLGAWRWGCFEGGRGGGCRDGVFCGGGDWWEWEGWEMGEVGGKGRGGRWG